MGYFRATGLPHSGNTANQGAGSSNDLVAAPGANKRIVIYDVIVVPVLRAIALVAISLVGMLLCLHRMLEFKQRLIYIWFLG